ncbi:MAG: hypothetical protein HY035_03140 [Nitrospirae bacterium]|nr:hypothetical protein [Nitrospirota bacterium]MBI3377386.1 hypothetical protein [Nitrospirota bacterium]
MTKLLKIIFWVFTSLHCFFNAHVYATEYDGSTFIQINETKATKYESIIKQSGLLAMQYVDSEKKLLVTVTKEDSKDKFPFRCLAFYKRLKGTDFKKISEYRTPDSFNTAYTSIDSDRLFTVWSTGSAFRLAVFSINNNEAINVVLYVGWKGSYELVHLTPNIDWDIIIPVGWIPGKGPQFAEVYKWDVDKYIRICSIPWDDRFNCKLINGKK